MTDLATLGIRVDTAGLKQGETALTALTSKGMQAEKATKSLGAATAVSGAKAAAFGNQMKAASGSTANLVAQFNDIGVMMAAGQNPLQLAMQQGTQINQVFAQLGGGRGAIRAVGAAFMSLLSPINLVTIGFIAFGGAAVNWLFRSGEEARDLADIIGDLQDALESADDATSKLETALSLRRARLEVEAMVDSLSSAFLGGGFFTTGVQRLNNLFDVTTGAASALRMEIVAIDEARGPQELLAALEGARDEAINLAGGIVNMNGAQLDFVANLESAISAMGVMQQQSADIARNLSAQQIFDRAQDYRSSGRGNGDAELAARRGVGGGEFDPSRAVIEEADILLGLRNAPNFGRGGKSEAEKSAGRARQIMDEARTAAERYADAIIEVNELQRAGHLTASEHAIAVGAINEQFDTGSNLAETFGRSIANLGADMVLNLGKGENAVESLLNSLARLAINTVFQKFVAPGLTAGLDSILPDFGGARAMGGPVSGGKSYLVGERGPELFTPSSSGGITPNHAIGGGTPKLEVNIINPPSQPTVTQGPNGRIDVAFDAQIAASLRSGPQTRRAMAQGYGLTGAG